MAAFALSPAAARADARAASHEALVRREFAELHMGMEVRIVLYAPGDSAAREAARAAYARIATLEDILSDWRAASEVRLLAGRASAAPTRVGPELCTVLAHALDLAARSDGRFDPTVGPYVELWRESRQSGRLPPRAALARAAMRVGWSKVRLDAGRCTVGLDAPGMRIDLGGIAKGYILDEALRELARHGVTRALLEAGGDIVVGDAPPGAAGWRIGVPHGDGPLAARARNLVRAAVSTSGDTEQYVVIGGVRYSHVIDPATGLGATGRRLATVVAPNGMTADGLVKAVALLGPERYEPLVRHYGALAAVRVLDGNDARRAPRRRRSGSAPPCC